LIGSKHLVLPIRKLPKTAVQGENTASGANKRRRCTFNQRSSYLNFRRPAAAEQLEALFHLNYVVCFAEMIILRSPKEARPLAGRHTAGF
jgi:hypothetical protein